MRCLSEPLTAAASWSEEGVRGCRRFLERVWKLQDMVTDDDWLQQGSRDSYAPDDQKGFQ